MQRNRSTIILLAATVGLILLTINRVSAAIFAGEVRKNVRLEVQVDPAATIFINDTPANSTRFTFTGDGGEEVGASEDSITVTACISTRSGNSDTVLQASCTQPTGETTGATIPAECISYTNTDEQGDGDWNEGALSNGWTTIAMFKHGSGIYSCDQWFSLTIPEGLAQDTYSSTITYQVVGF